jgi:hypothetical protein
MAYAGTDYGSAGAYNGTAAGAAANGVSLSSLTTAHASAIVVFFAMAVLIALRMGFRGVSLGGASVRVG